jgi:DNA-binding PadR family transcriptional regulator
MNLTALDALLVFLVSHKGQSGYDIRQLMQSTPLGMFSDSPGAIYPALARLEKRGLLTSAAEPKGRRKRTYERTDAGIRELEAWLRQPVDPDAMMRRPQEFDLRFVIVAQTLGRPAAIDFVRDCAAVEAEHLARVEAFRDGPGHAMDRAALDSLDLGLHQIRARLQWRRELLSKEGHEHESKRDLAGD